MTADRSPPAGVLTERQLLALHPHLTVKAIKRGELSGAWPRRVPLPAGGHGWRADEVQAALARRDAPASLARVPAGHVGIIGLVGVPRVSRCMARRAGDGRRSAPERQGRPGLVPLDEAGLRAAIAAGTFPAAAVGTGAECWPIDAVKAWIKRHA